MVAFRPQHWQATSAGIHELWGTQVSQRMRRLQDQPARLGPGPSLVCQVLALPERGLSAEPGAMPWSDTKREGLEVPTGCSLSFQVALSSWRSCDLQWEGVCVPEVFPAHNAGQ